MTPTDDLIIVPFVAEEFGNSAYLVGSRGSGEAVVIDPLRDVDQYLARPGTGPTRGGNDRDAPPQ